MQTECIVAATKYSEDIMTRTALTQDEINSVFEQLDLRNENKRAERAFSSCFTFQQDEISGVVHTRTTNCSSDQ
jgi:hypothetical protein